jgi:hypothetical protein
MSSVNRKASAVHNDILGGRTLPIRYHITHTAQEVWEVLQALARCRFKEAALEAQQVLFGIEMWYYQTIKEDFDLRGCADAVQEFYDRRRVWLELFKMFDIEFKSEYLDKGSNFRRPHKIQEAFRAAGLRINALHARTLSRKYTMLVLNNKNYVFSKA